MPSNHLILCCPPLLPPSIFPSIRSVQFSHSVVSNSATHELQHTRSPCCCCCCCCCCCIASVMSNSVRTHRQEPTRLLCPWDSPGKSTGVGCHCLLQCMKVKSESEVAQPCPTLIDPMVCSLPGSSAHGIFQARVLEWGAIAFSTRSPCPSPTPGVQPNKCPSSQ